MAGEIQIGGTTFATESGGTVTVSNVDSATNRQNLGLGIGVDVQSFDAATTKNDVANTFTANQIISVTDNTNAALRVTQLGTGNALVVEDSSNPDSTPFVVDGGGNLFLGKTSSSTATEGVELKPDVSTGYALSVTGTSQRVAIFNRLTSDGELISFRKDGTVVGTISTNANSLPSDRNFKKDISELEFGLDLVKKLKPKTYRYKINDDNSPFMIGLIAQDLEESLSEVGVNQNDCLILQYNENVEDGDSKYQLDYSKLIPVLIKATQEQETLIESQQSQIDALTARIEALENT